MEHKIRLWVTLGVAASVVAGTHAHADQPVSHATHGKYLLAQASGEGGGESGDIVADAPDDTAFLVSLALMEGHMRVGTELYKMGEVDMAKTHMKHPRDEVYKDLAPALSARKSPDFASALDAVAKAVETGASADDVSKFHRAFADAIHAARPQMLEAATAAKAVVALVRTAAEEYEAGVKGGKVAALHEYQDAWGFTQVAIQILASLSDAERDEHKVEIASMEADLGKLGGLWPDLAGKSPVAGTAKDLFAAAAKMELTALDIH